MEWGWLQAWLASWEHKGLADHLMSAFAGLVGSGVYAAVTSPRLAMPRWDAKKRELHLGFGGTVIIGVAMAVVVDYAFPVGVLAAVVAPTVLSLVNRIILPGAAKLVLLWAEGRVGMPPRRDSNPDDNP